MKKANTSRRPVLPGLLLGLLLAAPALAADPPQRPVLRPRSPALPPHVQAPAPAAADSTLAPPLPPDAAPAPRLRRPAADELAGYRRQREFQYVEGKPEQPSLWERLQMWFWEWLGRLLGTPDGRHSWNVVFYVVMAGLLAFAVLKLLQVDFTRLLGRAPRTAPLDYEAGQENIHELNFPDVLAAAEAAGNLRLAVRLGYLQLLKQLTDQSLIDWQLDKTNQAYLGELGEHLPALRPAFTELTRQFEYTWYGEVPIPPALYQQVREGQRQFSRQLGSKVSS